MPKTLSVDVMGSQVGVIGSEFTVCSLCLHRNMAHVKQSQTAAVLDPA